jgi:hypothetical protein
LKCEYNHITDRIEAEHVKVNERLVDISSAYIRLNGYILYTVIYNSKKELWSVVDKILIKNLKYLEIISIILQCINNYFIIFY